MRRAPPLRGRSPLETKKVLLIDLCQATREVRAAVLREHGIEVQEVEELSEARFLWQANLYDLVMLDVRRYPPGETLEFYEQIRDAYPGQSFAFFLGPPNYISRTWPCEAILDDESSLQWDQVITRCRPLPPLPCRLPPTSTPLPRSIQFAYGPRPPRQWLPSDGFSNPRPNLLFPSPLLTQGAPPKKH